MPGFDLRKVLTIGVAIATISILALPGISCSKPPKPTAAFTVSPVSGSVLLKKTPIVGLAPLTVQFSDQSEGRITSWKWTFGDASSDSSRTLQNPSHTYTVPGRYDVILVVKGPGGDAELTKSILVTVLLCSEAANSELRQARDAIQACLTAAGEDELESSVMGWDGTAGKVMAETKDAADYLTDWKTFRASYDVSLDGKITFGTDVSWQCVAWDNATKPEPRWRGV